MRLSLVAGWSWARQEQEIGKAEFVRVVSSNLRFSRVDVEIRELVVAMALPDGKVRGRLRELKL